MNSPKYTAARLLPGDVFDRLYQAGTWHTEPYNSGSGSDPNAEGRPYCEIMTAVLRLLDPPRIVDVGCGDGRIFAALASQLHGRQWTGIDCVPEIIARNTAALPHHRWLVNDLATMKAYQELPQADVYLVKDVLQHWPNQMIGTFLRAIKQAKKPCTVILTNDRNQGQALDCQLGGYRALSGSASPLREWKPELLTTYLHKGIYRLVF